MKVSHPWALEGWILLSWLVFIVNLTQPRAMGGEGTSGGELSTSDWSVGIVFIGDWCRWKARPVVGITFPRLFKDLFHYGQINRLMAQ